MALGAQEASGQARIPGEAGRDLLRGGKKEELCVRKTRPWPIPLSLPKELYYLREDLELQQEEWELPRDGVSGWGGQW